MFTHCLPIERFCMTKRCVEGDVEIKVGENTKKISIYRNGDKPNYYYYFRHNGVKYQGSCKSSVLKTSKENVREICYDLIKGVRQKGRKKTIKLDHIIKDFLEDKQHLGRKQKTLEEYTRQSKYILEWYNETSKGMDINVFFSQDRYKDYQSWRRSYYDTHDNIQIYERNGETITGRTLKEVVGNPSLNKECVLLHSILLYGKKHKGILKGVEIPIYGKDDILPEPSQTNEKVILSDIKDYNKVKEYWIEKDPFIWDCFSTIHHLGLRPGELGKIQYKNVHLKEGYVEIKNRKSKGRVINSNVPLDNTSRKTFQKLMTSSGIKKGKDDPVFVREGMEKPYTPPYLSKLFKKSVKLITGKDMTLHSLRHLFITRYLKKQIPLKILSNIVGHVDQTMLNKVYSHLDWKDNVYVVQKLEQEGEQEKQKQQNTTNVEQDVQDFVSK